MHGIRVFRGTETETTRETKYEEAGCVKEQFGDVYSQVKEILRRDLGTIWTCVE